MALNDYSVRPFGTPLARPMLHPYQHMIGKTIGVKFDGVGIVAGEVMAPEADQNENYIQVMLGDTSRLTVRYMDTYRADFINADIASAEEATPHNLYPHTPGQLYDCAACEAECFCEPDSTPCVYCAIAEEAFGS